MQVLETPSRIWRRIQDVEARDAPSLPSLPGFEDLSDPEITSESDKSFTDLLVEDNTGGSEQFHSTPIASLSSTSISRQTIPATNSATRFAQSIASRSSKSSHSMARSSISSVTVTHLTGSANRRNSRYNSFDMSAIPSLPAIETGSDSEAEFASVDEQQKSAASHVLPEFDTEDDISFTEEALNSLSRSGSPEPAEEKTPRKRYDYSVSLKSEPKPSPFDKFRNVALRKPLRARTPSLSRTTPSPLSSPTNSTPHSTRSFARSRYNTPARQHDGTHSSDDLSGDLMSEIPSRGMNSPAAIPLPRSRTSSPAVHVHAEQEPSITTEQSISQPSTSEPTFSSDDSAGPSSPYMAYRRSSPANSTMATPVPHRSNPSPSLELALRTPLPQETAEQPTPRPAHFLSTTPADTPPSDQNAELYDSQEETTETIQPNLPATPHSRRRSFLLSVINSTARPTIRSLHGKHARFEEPNTSIEATATPVPNSFRNAFAGATPRPRASLGSGLGRVKGTPHPLARGGSIPEEGSESDSSSSRRTSDVHLAVTPARSEGHAPFLGGAENQSYISTASSHDLTTHHYANTSYDALMMPGGASAVGRLNKGKLNTYLYGLNRRLEEENKALLERITALESGGSDSGDQPRETTTSAERRRSSAAFTGRNMLGDVAEEAWMEEKVELEAEIETLKAEAFEAQTAAATTERQLEEVKVKEKDRWKQKMAELERGVERIVGDLEHKLKDAERQLDDREHIIEEERARSTHAESLLESRNDLGGELKQANEKISDLSSDLARANSQVANLEDELRRSDKQVERLEIEVSGSRNDVERLESELQAMGEELNKAIVAQELGQAELEKANEYLAEIEEEMDEAVERIHELESALTSEQEIVAELDAAHAESKDATQRVQSQLDRAREIEANMQEALDLADDHNREREELLGQLKSNVASLERENQRLLERSNSLSLHSSQHNVPIGPTDADLEALEDELDYANKEIARLNALVAQSPARKALDKAKEEKIQLLEKENGELAERIQAIKFTTPSKMANTSGISPAHRQALSMVLRTPKTPGAPLRDLTWLNTTTMDASSSPLVEEIARLQKELDIANENIDERIDELEEAGLGVVGLTKKLEDARFKIRALEEDLANLTRRDERRLRQLERLRCQKCAVKIDTRSIGDSVSGDESVLDEFSSEPTTPPTRTSEALRVELRNVNDLLGRLKSQWQVEKQTLLGDKAALQDATNRLNSDYRAAQEQIRKHQKQGDAAAGINQELDAARNVILELEASLTAERAQLKLTGKAQDQLRREKQTIDSQMRRTEADMGAVKDSLTRLKQENMDLEQELRNHSNVEQKARSLEAKLSGNLQALDDLRQERSLLAADHKSLQRRFAEATERSNRAQSEHATCQATHENHRHQLDLYLAEIVDLKSALATQAQGLQRAQYEKAHAVSEKADVARVISELQGDLARVRKEAEAFGRDLKVLLAEKEHLEAQRHDDINKAERAKKQSLAQIRILSEQLEQQKDSAANARAELKGHLCSGDESQVAALELRHNKECKGLSLQIGYLKAKFIRESLFRDNLVAQKNYLLVLLDGFERSEKTICSAIAKIGFPVPPPKKRPRTLKSIATCVIFLLRARRSSQEWQKERAVRAPIQAALKEVRQRRVKSSRT